MMTNFQTAMAKLAVVGQDVSKLIDCSEVIPKPQLLTSASAYYPSGGYAYSNIQQTCTGQFPEITTDSESSLDMPLFR